MKYTKHLEISSFNDLKRKAYFAARQGIKSNFSANWRKIFIESYFPSTFVFYYKKVMNAYKLYLLGLKSADETKKIIDSVKDEYQEVLGELTSINKYIEAEAAAFKNAGIEYGKVEFTCPLCGGKAVSIRRYTPDNIAHKITVRSGCEKCGMKCMN